jgi:DeoR family suf operon transcriptional repressor
MMVSAMRGMRGEILVFLKQSQPLTAKELAERFGVTPNGLRRYLKELEDGGLVRYERVTRGVGGPSFAYTLTDTADSLFPDDYPAVLTDALGALRDRAGSDAVRDVFEQRWRELVQSQRAGLDEVEPSARGGAVATLLSSAGYMAEWQETEHGGTLIARHCALRAAAERFPEACEAEARMLAEVLGATVERRACITGGCPACEYRVRFDADRSVTRRDSRWMDEESA